jgi:death-on-curing protein
MRYLTLNELLTLHRRIMLQAGAASVVLNPDLLESSLAVPRMTFGGQELYPTVADKAAALAYSLVLNHPFLDGNKRTGHAAMEVFLLLNGHELIAPIDEQERTLLQVAGGVLRRDQFTDWVRQHVLERQ